MSAPQPVPRPGFPFGRVIALSIVIVASTVACNLPTDDRAVPYNVDDLPPLLTETTSTTTTTTTTTTTSTTVPQSSLPGATSTTTTTTSLPIQTAPVTVYYTLGSTDEMQPLVIQQATDVGPRAIVRLLESPAGLTPLNLRSSVRIGLIDEVITVRGVATIVLDPIVLDRMSEPERRRAVAQMVLTFTSFSTSDQGNIGFVQFESDGEHYEVFVPAFGGSSQEGDVLAFSDFRGLISTAIVPTTTSTTTTTTTTIPDGTATTVADDTSTTSTSAPTTTTDPP